jgi:hypothetical protein
VTAWCGSNPSLFNEGHFKYGFFKCEYKNENAKVQYATFNDLLANENLKTTEKNHAELTDETSQIFSRKETIL